MVECNGAGLVPHDCVLFSTADWDEPYWTNKQHTASLLASRGWRVLYVESVGFRSPKVGSGRDWARLWRRLVRGLQSLLIGPPQRAQNIWVLSPLMVPAKHHWPIVRRLNQWMLRRTVKRFMRSKRFKSPLIWTYHPFMLGAIAHSPRSSLVYHCVDDIAAIPGVDVDAFRSAERALLAECKAVFTTAAALRDACLRYNPNTHFFGNVVDDAHFGQALDGETLPVEIASIPQPRLVYHGVLSDFKIDFRLLLEVALARPEWHWVIIGEQREGQRSELLAKLSELPNVHMLGYVSYARLPDYLRGMQVGVLPTLLNDYTRSMFPMKFYEYLASGLRVVSTPLDFTKVRQPCLEVASGSEAFIDAIEKQLAEGKLSRSEIKDAVGENTWACRLDRMLRLALDADSPDSALVGGYPGTEVRS